MIYLQYSLEHWRICMQTANTQNKSKSKKIGFFVSVPLTEHSYATTRDINDPFFVYCLHFFFFLMLSKSFCVCFSCRLIVHIPIVGMFCASKMKMFFRIITSVSKNSIKTNLFVCLEIVHLDEINTEPTAYFGISLNLRV